MKTVLDQRLFRSKESATMHATLIRAALAAIVLLTAAAPRPCPAEPQSQATFASPEDASRALAGAVGRQDERAMTRILGGGKALTSAEDAAEDALDRQHFVQKYREMHRWARRHGGAATLYVGAENWPFPIPLVFDNGLWRFNSSAGFQEILFRRIGENEVVAVGMCKSLLTGDPPSATHTKVHKQPILFHGYYFHTLATSNGGFAAIAYPAVYRASGVKSFIVTEEGDLSEKDLGLGTTKLAAAMSRYQPDDTWTPVE
jgi:hypothetical protein